MTQTAWAHLPNAKHIDWVLASLKVHPKKWEGARQRRSMAKDEAWDAAWDAASDAARNLPRNVAWDAATVWDESNAMVSGFHSARDAISALVAWDDCAYMIESEIGELKILAKLGDPRAILLLPACIVFNETKVLV